MNKTQILVNVMALLVNMPAVFAQDLHPEMNMPELKTIPNVGNDLVAPPSTGWLAPAAPIGTIETNKNGKLEIVGEPNVEDLKRAVKKYEANEISKGKLKRPWYKPSIADFRRGVRNYGPTVVNICFSAVAAFK